MVMCPRRRSSLQPCMHAKTTLIICCFCVRFVSLPNAIKAKRRPVETVTPESLGVDCTPQLRTLEVNEPPARRAGSKVASVEELVERLHKEAKVI